MKPNSVDTIYYHGVIAAVDKDFSLAQAMAVSGDRICAIGSDREVLALRSEDTACVDLRGAFVVPGLQDAHVHATDYIHNLSHVPCAECRDIPELQEQLRHWAGEHPDLWILGNGLSQQVMDEGLDRIHLDAAVKDRPVILVIWHGHGCIANSAALERSGITVSTPDPPGGVIERDASGAPTGVLQEASALQLAYRGMPPYSAEEISEKLLRMQRFMNSMGYTAYTESTVGTANNGREGGAAGMACIRAYERLLEEKQLTCRVSVGFYSGRDGIQSPEILREDLAAGLVPKSPDEDWLSFHMLKFFCDGVEVAHTAWMKEDYADLPGCRGSSCFGGGEMSDEEQAAVLRETLKAAHDAGYQIGIHCIGNRAVHEAAEAIAAIQRENPRPDARHCIIHGDTLADREDLETCGKLGLVISSQPNLASDMYEKESECVGPDKGRRMMALRTVLDLGITVAGGSDSIAGPYHDWRYGMRDAILRRSVFTGIQYGPEECITMEEALRMYTMGGARQEFAETKRGSLEPGKLADFTVLDRNLLEIPPEELPDVQVLRTVVGGKTVFLREA